MLRNVSKEPPEGLILEVVIGVVQHSCNGSAPTKMPCLRYIIIKTAGIDLELLSVSR